MGGTSDETVDLDYGDDIYGNMLTRDTGQVCLDDDESGSPATPQLGKPDPEDAVSLAVAGRFGGMMDDGQVLAESQVLRDQRCSVSEKNSTNDPDETERRHPVPRLRLETGDSSGACGGGPQRGESRLESAGTDFSGGTRPPLDVGMT
jgi:hypothetical protein